MKDLRATRAQTRLQHYIDEGEHEQQDFKYLISDARKFARSVSAFANHSGGRLLIGVKDNGTIAGVRSEEDIYMIEQAAQLYCEPAVEVDFEAVKGGGGAVVFIATVPRAPRRPVSVKEADGTRIAYYRVKDENLVAPPLMVQAWRSANSADGMLLALTDAEQAILQSIASSPGLTHTDLAKTNHTSVFATERAVVRLLAMGLAEYRHDSHHFGLVIPETP